MSEVNFIVAARVGDRRRTAVCRSCCCRRRSARSAIMTLSPVPERAPADTGFRVCVRARPALPHEHDAYAERRDAVRVDSSNEITVGGDDSIGPDFTRSTTYRFDRVFAPDDLLKGTLAFARILVERAPLALGMAKHVINTCQNTDTETGRLIERLGQSVLIQSEDSREGNAAFREKRKPEWKGR